MSSFRVLVLSVADHSNLEDMPTVRMPRFGHFNFLTSTVLAWGDYSDSLTVVGRCL